MAATRYVTTKYGTRLNVTGLTPEQTKKVLATGQDKGAYGTKAAALADQLRKQNTKAVASTPAATPQAPVAATNGITGPDLGVNPKTGAIDPNQAVPTVVDTSLTDTSKTFNLNNPATQTDQFGNVQTITNDPATGQTSLNKTAGAPLTSTLGAFQSTIGNYQGDLSGQVQTAQDANYNYITKNYGQQKQQEVTAAKQELANRGIPIDPSPDSLYGRTLQQIDQKYQGMDDQAKNQAITSGNQTLATQAGVQNSNLGTLASTANAFTQNATPYQGGTSELTPAMLQLLSTISGADLNRYGIDKDFQAKLRAIAANKGGGTPAETGPILGGLAPGFNIATG